MSGLSNEPASEDDPPEQFSILLIKRTEQKTSDLPSIFYYNEINQLMVKMEKCSLQHVMWFNKDNRWEVSRSEVDKTDYGDPVITPKNVLIMRLNVTRE